MWKRKENGCQVQKMMYCHGGSPTSTNGTAAPLRMSMGPNSIRKGTPFISWALRVWAWTCPNRIHREKRRELYIDPENDKMIKKKNKKKTYKCHIKQGSSSLKPDLFELHVSPCCCNMIGYVRYAWPVSFANKDGYV